MLIFIAEAD